MTVLIEKDDPMMPERDLDYDRSPFYLSPYFAAQKLELAAHERYEQLSDPQRSALMQLAINQLTSGEYYSEPYTHCAGKMADYLQRDLEPLIQMLQQHVDAGQRIRDTQGHNALWRVELSLVQHLSEEDFERYQALSEAEQIFFRRHAIAAVTLDHTIGAAQMCGLRYDSPRREEILRAVSRSASTLLSRENPHTLSAAEKEAMIILYADELHSRDEMQLSTHQKAAQQLAPYLETDPQALGHLLHTRITAISARQSRLGEELGWPRFELLKRLPSQRLEEYMQLNPQEQAVLDKTVLLAAARDMDIPSTEISSYDDAYMNHAVEKLQRYLDQGLGMIRAMQATQATSDALRQAKWQDAVRQGKHADSVEINRK